jgi:hypothetical protein
MNSLTTPYTINPRLGSKDWKTEYNDNYTNINLNKQNTSKFNSRCNKSTQIKNPFSQYKIN